MGELGYLILRYADDILIFCKYEWEAEDALKRAGEILEGELKLKLSPEKTKIVNARKKGVEYLGFHFNGRWRRLCEEKTSPSKAILALDKVEGRQCK